MMDLDEPSDRGRLSDRQAPFQILGLLKLPGSKARLGAGLAEERYESEAKRSSPHPHPHHPSVLDTT